MELVIASALGLVLLALIAVIVLQVRGRAPRAVSDPALGLLRDDVRAMSSGLRDDLSRQRSELSEQLTRERDERQASQRDLRQELERGQRELVARLQADAEATRAADAALRESLIGQLRELGRENGAQLEKVRETVGEKLQTMLTGSLQHNADRIDAMNTANGEKHLQLQALLASELEKLRQGNEAKLEKMRETVDEKLQGTLEKRLGESFTLVSQRLEEVQRGLGEMQTLASDVGGLKRVLTNVKSRGGWGEVQLARQLEDMLTRDQYEENVAVRPGSNERVEFAIRMPGRSGDGPCYLAIDSKLPQEDYDRLLDAQEGDDKIAIETAGLALERAIVEQAKTISSKYIDPPNTTDFAIMYLPTEGLFAEVLRRPGLAARLQRDFRILVTGPTTLASILNSLQMGFRTLAIEKRSSEVWQVLAAAKAEFKKYGDVWDKLGKQLETAQNTVREAGTRTRAVERKLRGVEAPDGAGTGEVAAAVELAEAVVLEAAAIASPAAELAALGEFGAGRAELDLGLPADEDDEAKTA